MHTILDLELAHIVRDAQYEHPAEQIIEGAIPGFRECTELVLLEILEIERVKASALSRVFMRSGPSASERVAQLVERYFQVVEKATKMGKSISRLDTWYSDATILSAAVPPRNPRPVHDSDSSPAGARWWPHPNEPLDTDYNRSIAASRDEVIAAFGNYVKLLVDHDILPGHLHSYVLLVPIGLNQPPGHRHPPLKLGAYFIHLSMNRPLDDPSATLSQLFHRIVLFSHFHYTWQALALRDQRLQKLEEINQRLKTLVGEIAWRQARLSEKTAEAEDLIRRSDPLSVDARRLQAVAAELRHTFFNKDHEIESHVAKGDEHCRKTCEAILAVLAHYTADLPTIDRDRHLDLLQAKDHSVWVVEHARHDIQRALEGCPNFALAIAHAKALSHGSMLPHALDGSSLVPLVEWFEIHPGTTGNVVERSFTDFVVWLAILRIPNVLAHSVTVEMAERGPQLVIRLTTPIRSPKKLFARIENQWVGRDRGETSGVFASLLRGLCNASSSTVEGREYLLKFLRSVTIDGGLVSIDITQNVELKRDLHWLPETPAPPPRPHTGTWDGIERRRTPTHQPRASVLVYDDESDGRDWEAIVGSHDRLVWRSDPGAFVPAPHSGVIIVAHKTYVHAEHRSALARLARGGCTVLVISGADVRPDETLQLDATVTAPVLYCSQDAGHTSSFGQRFHAFVRSPARDLRILRPDPKSAQAALSADLLRISSTAALIELPADLPEVPCEAGQLVKRLRHSFLKNLILAPDAEGLRALLEEKPDLIDTHRTQFERLLEEIPRGWSPSQLVDGLPASEQHTEPERVALRVQLHDLYVREFRPAQKREMLEPLIKRFFNLLVIWSRSRNSDPTTSLELTTHAALITAANALHLALEQLPTEVWRPQRP